LIISVGRLVEKKGFADLVSACQRLKSWGTDFRCDIIGTGPLEQRLKEQIQQCGLESCMRLLGSMPQKELRQHYDKAQVFALSCIEGSDGDRDILPNVLKEAMAVGVPVVTTRLPGIEELITHGENGLLVPPGDSEALATALECLLTDAALRRRLAGSARTIIEERFDSRITFSMLKDLLIETTQQTETSVENRYEQQVS
jgi:glycosyltransferase involved in cell wall biosynthesis